MAESKAFQGFARMSCEARHDSQPVQWILPPGMSNRAFSGVIHIDWITRYVRNRFNILNFFVRSLAEVYHLEKHRICSIPGMKINPLK